MEHIACICKMRELTQALSLLEDQLMNASDISLYEAFVLCCVGNGQTTPSEIAQQIGLRAPHTSKIIAALEKKKLLKRTIAKEDKRQYRISLSDTGKQRLALLQSLELDIPPLLAPIFQ
jgi:DNA-binding MarR family transcriptional regulator